jgi:YidC/Oxa1 family membrane protein insertase
MSDESKRLPYGLIAATVILVGAYVGLRIFAPEYFDRPAAVEQAGGDAVTEGGGAAEARTEAAASSAAERAARADRQRTVSIETDDFLATFSDLNTGLVGLRLKGERYRTEDGRAYDIVTTDREEYFPYQLDLEGVSIPSDATWEAEQLSPTAVRFRYEGDGFVVTRKVEAGQGPYQLWSTVTVQNEGASSRSIGLRETIHHYVTREAEDEGVSFLGSRAMAISRGMCVSGEDTVREPRDELAEEPQGLRGGVKFAGVENTYFTLAMAPAEAAAESCRLVAEDRPDSVTPHGTLFEVSLVVPERSVDAGESTTFRTLAYAGPKDIEALQAAGHELSEIVDLGWFGFLARGLIKLLRFVHDNVGNWGVAIILLTFLVKLLLYPLTEKSFQSMAKMRILKPEMDRINELYGDDREKKGAAIMELYKKHQINPLAGCLPSLLQMPVWIALYQSLSTNIELYHAPFVGYWTDLSSPDQYFVLPLIVGGLMFVQQRMTPSTMDPMQAKIMLYMMPTMITAFMLFLPAGLCLYMVTNSTLGIGQQRWIQWRLDRASKNTEEGPTTEGPADETNPHDPASSGSGSVVSTRRAAGGKKRSQRGRA